MEIMEHSLLALLAERWWTLLLRGLVAIAFGLLAWFLPEITLTALILLFGAYALVDGGLAVWAALAGRRTHPQWWLLLLGGLIGIGIGVVTFVAPELTALALLICIAIWAVATGVLQIVIAIRAGDMLPGKWLLFLGGTLSIVFGVLLMVWPGAGILSLIWLLAAYAMVFGILIVVLAFKVRKLRSLP